MANQASGPVVQPSFRSRQRKKMRWLNRVIAVLAAINLTAAGVIAGYATDPLKLGRNAVVQTDIVPRDARTQNAIASSSEHEGVLQLKADSGGDPDLPAKSCEEEIKGELVPERAISVQFLYDGDEAIPNFHAEHYLVRTRTHHLGYLCTITLIPYEVKVMVTGRVELARSATRPTAGTPTVSPNLGR